MLARCCVAAVAVAILTPAVARADDAEPTTWEQLFFPFPIVGAPPQLEQQVQVFDTYSHGDRGGADVTSAELAYIASPHVGIVATIPYQFGGAEQATGLEDIQLLGQYLAAGSLADDAMLSIGVEATLPTGHNTLGQGDAFVGPFAYAAKRWRHRFVLEGDLTVLIPLADDASTQEILGTAMAAVMLTPRHFDAPIYAQVELDSTTYVDGPPDTLFVAPEIFVGPFASPINDGTRIAAGVSFELAGDPVHRQTYMLTAAFDIPNKYGY
jgi:hypothetical protein|nr:hypothetical protein [Kofleriaceae bacterium]